MNTSDTHYERTLGHNALTRWLHSVRYKHVLALFQDLASADPDKAIKVVEVGCAHGKLFGLLNERFKIDYIGIEINDEFVAAAIDRYGHNPNFRIVHQSVADATEQMAGADVLVALETLEHIPERVVVRVVEAIAAAKPKQFVCSVPVEIGPAIWVKNVGSLVTGYCRHKSYTWSETWWAGLYRLDKLPTHETAHIGFDWRWLVQTIRHNMKITALRKFPFNWLPAGLAFSVYIIARG